MNDQAKRMCLRRRVVMTDNLTLSVDNEFGHPQIHIKDEVSGSAIVLEQEGIKELIELLHLFEALR